MTSTQNPHETRRSGGAGMLVVDLTEYQVLKMWAEMLHDAIEAKKRLDNRVRSAPVFPDIFEAEQKQAEVTVHRIRLALRRQYRKTVPPGVRAWQEASPGIGDDTLARLIGHLGHPRIAQPSHWEGEGPERKLIPDPPFERTVGQLWQYCGHGSESRKHAGVVLAHNPKLKSLTWMMATAAIKESGRHIQDLLARPPILRSEPGACTVDVQPSTQPPMLVTKPSQDSAAESLSARPPNIDPEPTTGAVGVHSSQPPSGPAEPTPHAAAENLPPSQSRIETHAGPAGGAGTAGSADDLAERPYRRIYDARRLETVGRVDAAGKPWTDGHANADALRIVGKAILRDLWLAADI